MTGVRKIEVVHECASTINDACSRNWRKNVALSAEADVVLDLVETVAHNMRGHDEGKTKKHTDCLNMWGLLTADKSKLIQFV